MTKCIYNEENLMKIVKQLAVFLENKPGALLRVTEDLAKNSINILAISVSDTVDHAVVRLVVDEPNKALHLLGEAGVLVVENDLLEVNVANDPGQLTKICKTLENVDSNIEYAYGSAPKDGNTLMYLRIMDLETVVEKLKSEGL